MPRRWKVAKERRKKQFRSPEAQVLTWLLLRAQKVVLGRVGGHCGFNTHSLPGMGGGEKQAA